MSAPLSVYIHWPFCKAKCPYCDFNSHVTNDIEHGRWLKNYLAEIEYFKNLIPDREVTSIFFGGGTPSLMQPKTVAAIIEKIKSSWPCAENLEITLEANPTSIEAEKFAAFKDAGINRVSIGIQSLNDGDLKMLGREHSSAEALKALEIAGRNFSNFSFDLIYARPAQSLKSWREELKKALSFAASHLSLYQLTIEKGTPFYSMFKKGELKLPPEDAMAEMYEATTEICLTKNLQRYEVSNYAKTGFESRHNLSYWRYQEYLGIGPGAHGRLSLKPGLRTAFMMIHHPENWLSSVEKKNHGIQTEEELSPREITEELVMMGLRIKEGIARKNFAAVTGQEMEIALPKLKMLAAEGFLKSDSERVYATEKGIALLSSLTAKLLSH